MTDKSPEEQSLDTPLSDEELSKLLAELGDVESSKPSSSSSNSDPGSLPKERRLDLSKEDHEEEEAPFVWEEESKEANVQKSAVQADSQRKTKRLLLRFASGIIISLVILLIAAGGLVWTLSNENEIEERLAAQGLADLSMALLDAASIHTDDPTTISTEDFFLQHLHAVLPDAYLNESQATKEGQLKTPSYTVHRYTTRDLSRFLLIAEPRQNRWSWLCPKSSLLIESSILEVHYVANLAAWNNLLALVTTLDSVSSFDISSLAGQEPLAPLAWLAGGDITTGFLPPEKLARISPSAENLIYNAPRYYKFGKPLLDAAAAIPKQDAGNEFFVSKMLAQAQIYKRFHDMVFYSPQGLNGAESSYNTLKKFLPESHFIIGFVLFQSGTNLVGEADILSNVIYTKHNLDQGSDKQAVDAKESVSKEIISKETAKVPLVEAEAPTPAAPSQPSQVDSAFLKAKIEEPAPARQAANQPETSQLVLTLTTPKTAPSIIISAPKSADLFVNIRQAATLKDLNEAVQAMSKQLASQSTEKPTTRVQLQNEFEGAVLDQLGHLLLSPRTPGELPLQPKDRRALESIFQNSNINEFEGREFYLQEFDRLMDQLQNKPSLQRLEEQKRVSKKIVEYIEYDDTEPTASKEEELQESKKNIENLDKQKEEVLETKDKLTQVPLSSIDMARHGNWQQKYGRLGQQILLYASLIPPSAERDSQMQEAIGIMLQGTDSNRLIWQDILEARRLLAETSESNLRKIMYGGLGFYPDEPSLLRALHNNFVEYLDEKNNLAELNDPVRYQIQFNLLKETAKPLLSQIIENSQKIQAQARSFQENLAIYLERLRIFLKDYSIAKDQGFFVVDKMYQHRMQSRLIRKISHVEELKKATDTLMEKIISNSRGNEELAKKESILLQSGVQIKLEDTEQLNNALYQLRFPNLAAVKLAEDFETLFNLSVAPIPPQP